MTSQAPSEEWSGGKNASWCYYDSMRFHMKRILPYTVAFILLALFCRADGAHQSILTAYAAEEQTGCCYDAKNNYCVSATTKDKCGSSKVFEPGVNCKKLHPTCVSGALTFTPNVPIPTLFSGAHTVDETLFGTYVNAFYIYFAGVAGILAVVMIMYGGFHYITSLGNPQRMNQGKEIISNALIGLILVLTSYLLLNIINPRLTKLVLPDVGYYAVEYDTDIYCEAQDAMNGDHLATAAAETQKKYCDAAGSDTKVTYKDKNGVLKTCYSLSPSPEKKTEILHAAWDKQEACFPVKNDSKINEKTVSTIVYKLLPVGGEKGICENNDYTADDSCDKTQNILSFQSWLYGGCKRADVGYGNTDRCEYFQKLSCPWKLTTQVKCSYAGTTVNTACWKNGKANVVNTSGPGDGVRAHCIEPGNMSIEYVDGVCCMDDRKERIICSTVGPLEGEVEVPCSDYTDKGSYYILACNQRGGSSPPANCFQQVDACGGLSIYAFDINLKPYRCFASLYMFYVNDVQSQL